MLAKAPTGGGQALDANGMADDTIVVLTSDNGGERYSDTWPFTGRKTELLEGGLRIPAVVRWPARIVPGSTSELVTIHMDWLPTLLAAAGTAPDAASPSDGIDLLPWLTQKHGAGVTQAVLALQIRRPAGGPRRQLEILEDPRHTFLFDVVEDPMERANLKERHRAVYDRLVAQWDEWNATMLPLDPQSFTLGFTGAELADHFGVKGSI
jgi:arylsulfatase A-like enzyme